MSTGDLSKSAVICLCAETDERVHPFVRRQLEATWPYLWLDATDDPILRLPVVTASTETEPLQAQGPLHLHRDMAQKKGRGFRRGRAG